MRRPGQIAVARRQKQRRPQRSGLRGDVPRQHRLNGRRCRQACRRRRQAGRCRRPPARRRDAWKRLGKPRLRQPRIVRRFTPGLRGHFQLFRSQHLRQTPRRETQQCYCIIEQRRALLQQHDHSAHGMADPDAGKPSQRRQRFIEPPRAQIRRHPPNHRRPGRGDRRRVQRKTVGRCKIFGGAQMIERDAHKALRRHRANKTERSRTGDIEIGPVHAPAWKAEQHCRPHGQSCDRRKNVAFDLARRAGRIDLHADGNSLHLRRASAGADNRAGNPGSQEDMPHVGDLVRRRPPRLSHPFGHQIHAVYISLAYMPPIR